MQLNKSRMAPRRNCVDELVPAELAIHNAVHEVEKAGCHQWLTEAIMLLWSAYNKVSDFVEMRDKEG